MEETATYLNEGFVITIQCGSKIVPIGNCFALLGAFSSFVADREVEVRSGDVGFGSQPQQGHGLSDVFWKSAAPFQKARRQCIRCASITGCVCDFNGRSNLFIARILALRKQQNVVVRAQLR